jgi:hypothetical protein
MKMSKFKVGDKVRIKEGLDVDGWLDDAIKFYNENKGKVTIIASIDDNETYINSKHYINLDGGKWNWFDDDLELIEQNQDNTPESNTVEIKPYVVWFKTMTGYKVYATSKEDALNKYREGKIADEFNEDEEFDGVVEY